jgi:glycerol-3-phosphate cytidylyltransferase
MRIGITFGAFDLLHAGHCLMLQEAKTQCDYLIVGLQTDPTIDRASKNKPVQSLVERYIQLKALSVVDEIIPYQTESELLEIIRSLPINVRIIGADYLDKDFTGKSDADQLGIETYYNRRDHAFSSSDIRNRVWQNENNKLKSAIYSKNPKADYK